MLAATLLPVPAAAALPLGNVSLGLALAYAAAALAWLALSWREPRSGLLFVLGPLLAPIGAIGLVPLATWWVRAAPRRAAQAAAAVIAAGVVAGLRHGALPLTGVHAPLGVGVAGANDPLDVAGTLYRALTAQQALVREAVAFAVVAALLPAARARGRWGAAGLGALMLAATLLPVPAAAALPLVLAAWITAAVLALRS